MLLNMKNLYKLREEAERSKLLTIEPVVFYAQPGRIYYAEKEAREYFPKIKYDHYLTDIELGISAYLQSQMHLQLVLKIKDFLIKKESPVMIQAYAFKVRDKMTVFLAPSVHLYIETFRKVKGFVGAKTDNQYFQVNIYSDNQQVIADLAREIDQAIGGNTIQRINWVMVGEIFNINPENAKATWNNYLLAIK